MGCSSCRDEAVAPPRPRSLPAGREQVLRERGLGEKGRALNAKRARGTRFKQRGATHVAQLQLGEAATMRRLPLMRRWRGTGACEATRRVVILCCNKTGFRCYKYCVRAVGPQDGGQTKLRPGCDEQIWVKHAVEGSHFQHFESVERLRSTPSRAGGGP